MRKNRRAVSTDWHLFSRCRICHSNIHMPMNLFWWGWRLERPHRVLPVGMSCVCRTAFGQKGQWRRRPGLVYFFSLQHRSSEASEMESFSFHLSRPCWVQTCCSACAQGWLLILRNQTAWNLGLWNSSVLATCEFSNTLLSARDVHIDNVESWQHHLCRVRAGHACLLEYCPDCGNFGWKV